MPRTSNQAIPYWQFDVGLFDDLKIVDLNDKYGFLGEGVLFRILSIIAKTNGYYAEINDQLILSIYRSCGRWIKNRSVISEVIDYCGVCGLFDVNLLLQNVITSCGIQRRWLYVKQKSRAKGYSTAKYWLIFDEQVEDILLPEKDKCSNNDDKCNINSDKCSNNTDIKTIQNKGNKSKDIDSQTANADEAELEFYLNNLDFRIAELNEDFDDYRQRIRDIVAQSVKLGKFQINKVEVSLIDFLKAIISLFANPIQFMDVLDAVDSNPSIKNKFLYTVAALYNTAMNF